MGQLRAALQTLLFLDTWDPATQSSEDGALWGFFGCDGSTLTALCKAGQQASVLRFFRFEPFAPSAQIQAGTGWMRRRPGGRWLRFWMGRPVTAFSQVCAAVLLGQGSSVLRGSMTLSLARLGNSDGLVDVTPKPSERAAQIVAQALPPDPARWLGLEGSLTRLAEAAPEAFLACVERTLAPAEGSRRSGMRQRAAIRHRLSPRSSRFPVRWPSWRWTSTCCRRSRCFGTLGRTLRPIQAKSAHRPSVHTLEEIFDPRWPKTNATIEERLTALEP